jgi:hypothetical protein
MALQAAGMLGVWWFAKHVLAPYGGIPGALVWLAACFLVASWLDTKDGGALPWRFTVAVTVLMLANFAIFLLALKLAGGWGLVWTPAFLFFGYRLANVIDERAMNRVLGLFGEDASCLTPGSTTSTRPSA